MNNLEKNVAVLRGEVLAANLLSSVAIQLMMMRVTNREETLAAITAWIDDSLNRGRPAQGDADDEFNTQMRETARFQAMQFLDGLRLNFPTRQGTDC